MKKLLAVVLVCAIMAVCGASAFAETNRSFQYYSGFVNSKATNMAGGERQFLNIYRSYSGNLQGTESVSVWSKGSESDQYWNYNFGSTEIVANVHGPNGELYSLNIYRVGFPYQCTVYPSSQNAAQDKTFEVFLNPGITSSYHNVALRAVGAYAKVVWDNTDVYTDDWAKWSNQLF